MINNFYGDSITLGAGCPFPYSDQGALVLTDAYVNNAVSGSQVSDQANAVYATNTSSGNRYTLMLGTNDQWHYLTDSNKRAFFKSCLSAEAYWLGGVCNKANGGSGWTFTGSWSNTYAFGIGKVSSNPGDTASVQFSGDQLDLGYISQGTANGQFSVSVDGVNQGTFNCYCLSDPTTYLGRGYGPQLLSLKGFGSGNHTCLITVLTGGNVYIDWVGGGSSGYPVYIISTPRYSSSGYASNGGSDSNIALFASDESDVVSSLSSRGLNIKLIDAHSFMDPNTDLLPDGLHPNTLGQCKLMYYWIKGL